MHPFLKGLACWAVALATGTAAAQGSAYPNKPLRVILPIAAGSVTDVVLRAALPALQAAHGQPIVIDNRPGASGILGAEACAKAVADGNTVCAVYHSVMSYNPVMFDKLPYDPQKDFLPVTRMFYVVEGLVVPASLPVRNVAELRAYAQKNPQKVNLGTLGEGSLQELFLAWLNRQWQTRIEGVPYKGGGPIANALAAGEIQIGQMGLGNFVGLIQGGQLRALALSSDQRSRQFPDVPTMAQVGLGGFPARTWWGIAAPAGTPAPVVAHLHQVFASVFKDPKFEETLQARYVDPIADSPAEFAAFLEQDREAAGQLVRLAREPRR